MKVNCVGGGPAGLAFAMALKKLQPEADVTVFERNSAGARQGFGVVVSEGLIGRLAQEDPFVYRHVSDNLERWDTIEVRLPRGIVRCPGFWLNGMSRETLVRILVARCVDLGVRLVFQQDVTHTHGLDEADVLVAADGVYSGTRDRHPEAFGTEIEHGGNRFAWLGTTRTYDAFTFSFRENADGLWWTHAYPYGPMASTFIVEGSEETWSHSGLLVDDEAGTADYFQRLFEQELAGHPLIVDRSSWRAFPTVKNRRWHHGNVVLLGDAAHTAHFSVGSGMKIAVDGAFELAHALAEHGATPEAFEVYERAQRPRVERMQRLGATSQAWFESLADEDRGKASAFAKRLINRTGAMDDRRLRELEASMTMRLL